MDEKLMRAFVKELCPKAGDEELARKSEQFKQIMSGFNNLIILHDAMDRFVSARIDPIGDRPEEEMTLPDDVIGYMKQHADKLRTEVRDKARRFKFTSSKNLFSSTETEFSVRRVVGDKEKFYSLKLKTEADVKDFLEIHGLSEANPTHKSISMRYEWFLNRYQSNVVQYDRSTEPNLDRKWKQFCLEKNKDYFRRIVFPMMHNMHKDEAELRGIYFAFVDITEQARQHYRRIGIAGTDVIKFWEMNIDNFYYFSRGLKSIKRNEMTFGQSFRQFFDKLLAAA